MPPHGLWELRGKKHWTGNSSVLLLNLFQSLKWFNFILTQIIFLLLSILSDFKVCVFCYNKYIDYIEDKSSLLRLCLPFCFKLPAFSHNLFNPSMCEFFPSFLQHSLGNVSMSPQAFSSAPSLDIFVLCRVVTLRCQ